ncbi:ATPase, T2SS/T4P/T4SS family [Bifidobacterium magnum]|uniref:ATP-binding cassette domain-containing protein n=1 Tax=Bifidobacterium magnum TaxID=1692 RepID=UPI000AD2F72E|nr:ATPase, T2SS/T4P/T4SS family [Bifidobacterium magnum]
MITHDIAVIDRLASRSYLLHRVHDDTGNHTVMDLHEGSWEDIERQVDERDMTAQRQLAQAKSETKRLVAERVQRREKTRRAAAASMRVPDRHDHDASKRKKLAKGGLDAGVSRNVARLEGRIAAARQAQEGFVTETKRRGGVVNFTVEPSKRHELMHLEPGTISFENGAYSGDTDDREAAYGAKMEGEHIRIGENGGKSAMLAIPGISVGPRDRILVTGPNGSGKTTLVNALMNTLDPDIPRLVIEQNADDPQHLLDQLAQLDGTDRQEALGYFVAQNGNVHAVLEGGELSPGECRKLMLALGLVQKPQILILDEPTNHLDLSSKRALAAMLYAYPGALVLVTHDELMIEAMR